MGDWDGHEGLLGDKAVHGMVGYSGEAHAAAIGTYFGVDAVTLNYATVEDSGEYPQGRELRNLYPLIVAALNEAGFALELGPLSTWSN